MKGIIIYKGKYGATRQYAEWLGDILNLPVTESGEITKKQVGSADFFIIGTSVYFGKFKILKWLKKNAKAINNRKLFFFIVNATAPDEQAKRDKFVQDNISGELRQRAEIYFLPGRLIHKELTLSDKLLVKMAGAMMKDPVKKEAIRADMDAVKKDNLIPLIRAVNMFRSNRQYPVARQAELQ